jgi:hypothetical protein
LFWVVELPEDAIRISNHGRRASVQADDVCVLDSFQFGGPVNVPASVTYKVEWEANGPSVRRGKGKAVPADDQAAFLGDFAPALAKGTFSGRELAFSFKSDPGASSARGYALLGTERNGVFL